MKKITKNLRTKPVYTRLDPELDEWLDKIANERGQSKASIIYQSVKLFRRWDGELERATREIQAHSVPGNSPHAVGG